MQLSIGDYFIVYHKLEKNIVSWKEKVPKKVIKLALTCLQYILSYVTLTRFIPLLIDTQ